MADENKIRIKDQPLDTALSPGDLIIVDSEESGVGTRKFDLGAKLGSIDADITDIQQDLADLQEEIEGGGSGLTDGAKQALLACIAHIGVWSDEHGQEYYDDLYNALYAITAISLNTNSLSFANLNSTQQLIATTTPTGGNVTWSSSNTSVATVSSSGLVTSVGYGNATITATSGSVSASCSVVVAQATLSSISAVYTQSGDVYDSDSLDSLKSDLVVTAHWSNSTTSTVADTDYILSGTLEVGTSTITVQYGGKTTTFNVTVSELDVPTGYTRLQYLRQEFGYADTDGPTYINTQKVISDVTKNITIKAKVRNTRYSYNKSDMIIGNRANGATTYGFYLSVAANHTSFDIFNGETINLDEGSAVNNVDYDLTAIFSQTASSISDGTLSNSGSISTPRDWSNTPICVGAVKGTTANGSYQFLGRIYSVELYEGDEALLNLVPCRRDSDKVVGMYDFVSRTFMEYYDDTNVYGGPTVDNISEAIIDLEQKKFNFTSGVHSINDGNCVGITIKYEMDEPTSTLYPAGILPYASSGALTACNINVYDDNDNILSYISERTQSGGDSRWAQINTGTLTEFSQSWNISAGPFSKIAFTVDLRCLDDSYMYDKTTGQVWFAGINTPYYGMRNISEANS